MVIACRVSMATSPSMPSPAEALERLIEGNRRFRDSDQGATPRPWSHERAAGPQLPFAIVLGCSDSRTPVEILFDQGLGELFVVRLAGNIVAPSVVGSIEFAASQFGTRLVVVMGHTQCGAIAASVQAIETGDGPTSQNIRAITDRITPHIESLFRLPGQLDRSQLIREAMRANVQASADHLRHGSRLLEDLLASQQIEVVAAEYELETGTVHFLQ